MIGIARTSINPFDFALVAMLGLLELHELTANRALLRRGQEGAMTLIETMFVDDLLIGPRWCLLPGQVAPVVQPQPRDLRGVARRPADLQPRILEYMPLAAHVCPSSESVARPEDRQRRRRSTD